MYALMYPILYIASIHCYIPLSTATSMSVCSVCIVLWHDHVNGEIKALKKNKKTKKNNNDNDYNHNNDTINANNENDNDKNSSDSKLVTV